MKNTLLIILIFAGSTLVSAQYPFDKFPKPAFKSYSNWKQFENKDEKKTHQTLTIPKFFSDSTELTLLFTLDKSGKETKNILRIYKGKKPIQRFNYELADYRDWNVQCHPLKVADLNGDSLRDIKITYDYNGNGLSLAYRPIYLIQNNKGLFTKYSFDNEYEDRIDFERDFDNDGTFEIQSVQIVSFNDHNYWKFTVFKITDDGLVDISDKVGYPIFIQFLWKRNHRQAEIIPSKEQAKPWMDLSMLTDAGIELK